MARITLVGVAKAFNDKQILDRLDLDIENGELLALLGPSGSGKTTLLKLIAGLDTPSAGRIKFDGSDVTLVSTRHRQAIIVFQDHCLFPHLTVKENIAFGLRARNEPRATIDRKVGEILEVVQLPGRQNSLPHALSGGEKQRIALARACVLKPRVLLLDEPFSNLDVNLRLSMREFVVSLQRVLKLTCVLVTHDKEEAFVMAERVAVLLDGRLEQVDTPENLYDRPKNKKVAEFLGEANFFPGVVADGVFTCALGSFATPWQDTRQAVGMVRYDNVQLGRHTGNTLGKIKDKVFAGRYTFYKVALAAGGELMASCKESFTLGDAVYVSCADHAMQVYSTP
ncbi:MAG: Spermidine/putrescine import ATP-binding protein PotA [Firmicutes bacterium]|nr:Spermidine/putrescine import ATP-binding protein PotA [candidate division NPL-UPA2 bacterium]MBT9153591.1 Spermidine/putrescine import ATP-binding protein PotA [candidate division NPL-UPA2 bacterium]MBT9155494.1 Spermidine/putrescine import ATP-binding protein PotA [candidate division NPL-UPA2 bacterium]